MTPADQLRQDIQRLLSAAPTSPPLLALDGPAAAGKSSLARSLQASLGLGLIAMDDFFLQPSQRQPDRLQETGGFIDYERFEAQVLLPYQRGHDLQPAHYDCRNQTLLPGPRLSLDAFPAILVEGVYALHPRFRPYYARGYFLDIDKPTQRKRLEARESPASFRRFQSDYLPREEAYFTKMAIRSHADLVVFA